jgi:predicted RNase H-like HicB family nuclease
LRFEDVVEAAERWNRDLETTAELQSALPYHQHFYFMPETGRVGPSKFVGYRGMTGERYASLTREEPGRGGLDGGVSERNLKHLFRALVTGSAEERYVRAKVEEVFQRYGRKLRKGAVMHAPQRWTLTVSRPSEVREPISSDSANVRRVLQRTIKASLYRDEEGFFVAECTGIPVATQGDGIEDAIRNLQEAVSLYFDGEDVTALGFVPSPSIIVTMELEPAVA